jgi:NDP-sugar pyrophosphorylase family protein
MQLSSGDVVALNGDCITNLNLNECISAHRTSGAMASVIAVPLVSPYGVLEIEENKKITGFKEKPNLPYWINAGIYVLNSEITELLPDIGDHETTTFPQLAKQGLLNSFTTNAFWRTIDTIKDLNEVRSDMERFLLSAFFQPVVANAQSYAP